jgi:hypothetical protein
MVGEGKHVEELWAMRYCAAVCVCVCVGAWV